MKPTKPASEMIRALDGARVRGGCEHCDAYQTVQSDHYGADMHRIVVHHDDWCPFYARLPDGPEAA